MQRDEMKKEWLKTAEISVIIPQKNFRSEIYIILKYYAKAIVLFLKIVHLVELEVIFHGYKEI